MRQWSWSTAFFYVIVSPCIRPNIKIYQQNHQAWKHLQGACQLGFTIKQMLGNNLCTSNVICWNTLLWMGKVQKYTSKRIGSSGWTGMTHPPLGMCLSSRAHELNPWHFLHLQQSLLKIWHCPFDLHVFENNHDWFRSINDEIWLTEQILITGPLTFVIYNYNCRMFSDNCLQKLSMNLEDFKILDFWSKQEGQSFHLRIERAHVRYGLVLTNSWFLEVKSYWLWLSKIH